VALAIIIGIIAGVVGFAPLWGAIVAAKRVNSTSNFSHASILLLAVTGSVVVLFGSAVLCVFVDRPDILPFAGGEAAGIIAVAIIVGIRKVILNKR
jgi:hypothetical protein